MTDWRSVVRACAPHADARIVEAIARNADRDFARWRVNTPLRQAHFFCHSEVESAGFTKLEENLTYSAERLCEVWPSRFRSLAAAEPYAHNPKALANKVYGGRMGNRPDTDDGWLNRGQGLIETTGAINIGKLAEKLGIPIEETRRRLTHPDHMLECAVANFVMNGCLPYADRDEIDEETVKVNGGYEGLAARRRALKRYKCALGIPVAVGLFDADEIDEPPLMPAEQVKAIQRQLKARGYFPGAVDGVMGVSMAGAISELQRASSLPVTGALNPATEAALWSNTPRPIAEERASATEEDIADEPEIVHANEADASHAKAITSAAGASTVGGFFAKNALVDWLTGHKDSLVDSFQEFKQAKAEVTEVAPGLLPWLTAHAAEIAIVLIIAALLVYAVTHFRRARAATRRIRLTRVVKHNTNADRSR
jgi:putative chitinase